MSSTEPPNKDAFVVVRTTRPSLPFPTNEDRQPILTERLILRPFVPEDIDQFHELRTQPEVMKWTVQARPDRDIAETRERMEPFLGGNAVNRYNFAICLRSTGEFIGSGGSHNPASSFGWPELGYMLKREQWGKGLATEFVKAFLSAWEALPREEVELAVDERSVVLGEDGRAREAMIATTDETNGPSQKILGEKCGFEKFAAWGEEVTKNGEAVYQGLLTWRYFPRQRGRT